MHPWEAPEVDGLDVCGVSRAPAPAEEKETIQFKQEDCIWINGRPLYIVALLSQASSLERWAWTCFIPKRQCTAGPRACCLLLVEWNAFCSHANGNLKLEVCIRSNQVRRISAINCLKRPRTEAFTLNCPAHLLLLVPSLHENDERGLLGDHLGRLRQFSQRLSTSHDSHNGCRLVKQAARQLTYSVRHIA